MGGSQSKLSDHVVQQELIERLQALHTKYEEPLNEKDGYVYLGQDTTSIAPASSRTFAQKQNVSADALQEWEKELMEDPKVCQTLPYRQHGSGCNNM